MKNFNEWILECPICNSKFKLKKCFESDNTYYVCDHYSIYIEEPIEELDFLRRLNIYFEYVNFEFYFSYQLFPPPNKKSGMFTLTLYPINSKSKLMMIPIYLDYSRFTENFNPIDIVNLKEIQKIIKYNNIK